MSAELIGVEKVDAGGFFTYVEIPDSEKLFPEAVDWLISLDFG